MRQSMTPEQKKELKKFQYRSRVTPFAAGYKKVVQPFWYKFQYRSRVTPFAAYLTYITKVVLVDASIPQ